MSWSKMAFWDHSKTLNANVGQDSQKWRKNEALMVGLGLICAIFDSPGAKIEPCNVTMGMCQMAKCHSGPILGP